MSVARNATAQLRIKHYEKGNLEDHHSGHRQHSDSGSDRTGHHELHGAWSNCILTTGLI